MKNCIETGRILNSLPLFFLLALISCGKNSTSKSGPHKEISASKSESVLTIDGLKNLGLTFGEVGHRTSEYKYAIECADRPPVTNQDRLDNLTIIGQKIAKLKNEKPNARYRVYCSNGEEECFLNGDQIHALIKEAINKLNEFAIILPSKYCPNSNLTPNGVVIKL